MIRMSSMFWGLLVILASAALYHTSYHVQSLQQELDDYNEQIAAEREQMHVLQAEWSYLAAPDRLQQLANKHLGMQRAKPYQVVTLQQLDQRLPLKSNVVLVAAKTQPPKTLVTTKPVTMAQAENAQAVPASVRNLLNNFGAH
jgi:cell division protein FtsL